MASIRDRVPQNAPGRYYVDSSCIYCELCVETAPNIFKEDNPNGWAFVFHQPKSEEDEIAAREALEGCPTESIGADGI